MDTEVPRSQGRARDRGEPPFAGCVKNSFDFFILSSSLESLGPHASALIRVDLYSSAVALRGEWKRRLAVCPPRLAAVHSRFARGCSSVGRARAWHARGQGFEPPQLHFFSRHRRSDWWERGSATLFNHAFSGRFADAPYRGERHKHRPLPTVDKRAFTLCDCIDFPRPALTAACDGP